MSENQTSKFVCGVLDTFELANTDDLAVVGRVKGTLNKGDKICITNYGDDDDELVVSSIVAIEVDKKPADSVTDSFAALRIREGASENIKPGSVLHSEDTEEDDIRLAYVSSIGDSYVGRRDLEIYETELNRMSITDCSEAWRIFNRVHEKKEGGYTDEEIKELRRKMIVIAGNHDSGARLASGRELLEMAGLYVSGKMQNIYLCAMQRAPVNGYLKDDDL